MMRRMNARALAVAWLAIEVVATAAAAQDPVPAEPGTAPPAVTAPPKPLSDAKTEWPSDFARFVATDDGGHFDTAITRYRNQDGVEVTLYAAVHIADAACYALLSDRFRGHEALLYELVGPENYRPNKGEARGGFVSMLQMGLKTGLELQFQLDGIDYHAANFVHADMTPKEFRESMDERGESLFMMLWSLGLNAQKQMLTDLEAKAEAAGDEAVAAPGDVDLLRAFRNREGRHQLRLLMAQQLETMELAAAGGTGSTLLEGRNEKCLAVLQREIAAGRKNLGIYYGGAHLPHMEQRLCKDLGFAKVDHEWIVAWDCSKRADPVVDREVWRQRRRAKADLDGIRRAALRWRDDHGDAAPTVDDLRETKDGAAYWAGEMQDPWGRPYSLLTGSEAPFVSVHSLGQDGIADTADDLHTAAPSDRAALRGEPVRLGGRVDKAATERMATARIEQASADCQMVREVTKLFVLRHARVPTMADLTAPDARGKAYLDGPLKDPWGRDYAIRGAVGASIEVRSAGADGTFDTADDVVAPAR